MVIYLKLFLTAIFWGGTFVAARIVAQHVGPYSASFLRFLTASLFLLVMITLKEGRIPRLERHQVLPATSPGDDGGFCLQRLLLPRNEDDFRRPGLAHRGHQPGLHIAFIRPDLQRTAEFSKGERHLNVPHRCDDRHFQGRSLFDLQG